MLYCTLAALANLLLNPLLSLKTVKRDLSVEFLCLLLKYIYQTIKYCLLVSYGIFML